MEGIPANSSIAELIISPNLPVVKYSPRKMAMAMEKGRDSKRARAEVIRVPIINGKPPNLS